jgi:hypothetical protein
MSRYKVYSKGMFISKFCSLTGKDENEWPDIEKAKVAAQDHCLKTGNKCEVVQFLEYCTPNSVTWSDE